MKDISNKTTSMPPNAAILYRNDNSTRAKNNNDPCSYFGVTKITEPGFYWVLAWPRLVNGKTVVELEFKPKQQ